MNLDKLLDKLPFDSLANFKPAHYFGIFAVLTVLIVGVLYFIFMSPNAEKKAKLDQTLVATEQKLAKYLAEGAKKEAMTKQVAALFGTLGEKKRQLPLAEEIPHLIHKITNIGDFLGVDIISFSMKPAKKEDFYKSIPVSMTIVGNYHQTAGFFDSLQNLLRVVKVTGFMMNVKGTPKIVVDKNGRKKKKNVKSLQTNISANTFAYIEGSEK